MSYGRGELRPNRHITF